LTVIFSELIVPLQIIKMLFAEKKMSFKELKIKKIKVKSNLMLTDLVIDSKKLIKDFVFLMNQ
jgi:hypothetical protein